VSSPPKLIPHVLAELPCNMAQVAVLDCGCGYGRWGHLARSRNGGSRAFIVGADIFEKYILAIRSHSPYDELVLCDIRKIPFRETSFDLILACEVIEHMNRKEGTDFLKNLEMIARKRIVVTTPNGYYSQGVEHNNAFQVHRSGWSVSDLRKLDFEVKGVGFLMLRPPPTLPSIIRRPLWSFAKALAVLSDLEPVVRLSKMFPRIGAILLGVKETGANCIKRSHWGTLDETSIDRGAKSCQG